MDGSGMDFLLDTVDRFPLRQEFADNLEQLDPVPLVFLSDIGAGLAVPADSNAGSGIAEKVGEDATFRAREGARRRRDASPTRSAQSADRANPESPGWT